MAYARQTKDVDAITACFANAFAAAGGLCAGPTAVVDHQRLSGQGYCYSASMPALLAAAGLESLHMLEQHPEWVHTLRKNIADFRARITDPRVVLEGDELSPIIHLRLRDHLKVRDDEEMLLQDIVSAAYNDGVLFTRAKYVVKEELHCPPPSIRIAISAGHTQADIAKATDALERAIKSVLDARRASDTPRRSH